jgi:hypothetical protein
MIIVGYFVVNGRESNEEGIRKIGRISLCRLNIGIKSI